MYECVCVCVRGSVCVCVCVQLVRPPVSPPRPLPRHCCRFVPHHTRDVTHTPLHPPHSPTPRRPRPPHAATRHPHAPHAHRGGTHAAHTPHGLQHGVEWVGVQPTPCVWDTPVLAPAVSTPPVSGGRLTPAAAPLATPAAALVAVAGCGGRGGVWRCEGVECGVAAFKVPRSNVWQ
ncbi:hypothetical protein E2C01_090718 [Portunus trituberculatus]|uniref:Uncharacterized protein n=1 Tax=Portunus trituberculatus TaxID=210409 RepID=A0A5B7JHC9_PORTR|nr:hypothetical protein [Portunus trituberculatus]